MSDNINVVIKYAIFHELLESYQELFKSYKYKCNSKCPFCDGEYGEHNPFCESSEAKIVYRVEQILRLLTNM